MGSRGVWWFCFACFVGVFGAEPAWAAPFKVEVLEDSPSLTRLRFELLTYGFDPVEVEGESHVALRLPRAARHLVEGEPDLPTVTESVLVDPSAQLSFVVVDSSYSELLDVDLAPSRGNLTRDVDPTSVPFALGPVYGEDAFFPGAVAGLEEPYWLRTYRGVPVRFRPFQYNPVTRVLRVYDHLTVELRRTGTLTTPSPAGGPSRSFHELASRHFVNFASKAAYAPLDEEGALVILAPDEWLPNLQPLVDHKNGIGIPTTAVGMSAVGNSTASIKAFIQEEYASGNLAFVLLVGDASQVATPFASGGAADPSYAKLAGNDSYPEVMVGRFSATSAAHVDTQVARTIAFEAEQATQQPWFKKAMGIASTEGPGDDGQYDDEHIDAIRSQLLAGGFTEVDQFYGYSAGSSDVVAALNEGRGLVNYCGHGSPSSFGTTGFSNSNVPALDNAGRLPFVMSVACNTGEFDTGTCLGEAMLRATNGGQPTGAVGFYASSILQSWNPPMEAQDEMNELFLAGTYTTMGALLYAGSSQMMDQYGSDGAAMFTTWHLFGDPSLRVVGTVEPQGAMQVSPAEGLASTGEIGGPFSPATKSYTVANTGDAALSFSVSGATPWLTVAPTAGALGPGESVEVVVAIAGTATMLGASQVHTTLAFTNETDHAGDTSRDATLEVGEPDTAHRWPLDVDPGWTTEGSWAFGVPSGQGATQDFGAPDPTSGFTGSNVYGYALGGDYANNLAEKHLTTHAIDCSELSSTRLRFMRWLNLEGSQYDHGSVRVSNDGATWTTVLQNSADLTDSSWQLVDLDISALADGQPTLFVRWTMGATDEGLVASGWNLDDIEILGFPAACSDDLDADGDPTPQCGGGDCDDGDPTVFFGAAESCNGRDDDCDGEIDDGCEGSGGPGFPGGPDELDESGGPMFGVTCSVDLHDRRTLNRFGIVGLLATVMMLTARRKSRGK
jgi:hypothetical protein